VQAALRALGHASGRGRPDGRFGPETRDALRDFQAVARLDPTGHVDRPTLEALKRQAARLQATLAPEKPAAAASPRPTPPEPAATVPPPAPPPLPPRRPRATVVEAAPEPALARALPATTMGVCRLRSSSWTGERQLMYAQCRKLGGAFTPFDD
jgi:peptidoglycan hydrolase-like protein with peptidoglycan-binding domain